MPCIRYIVSLFSSIGVIAANVRHVLSVIVAIRESLETQKTVTVS